MSTQGLEGRIGATPARYTSDEQQGEILEHFGYEQQLDREMGWFSSFAASFSGVSITTGVLLTLPFVLTQAGTGGLWTWVLSAFGCMLIASIFADLAGRIPLAGYAYQWASRLTNPNFGWFVAVCGLIGFGVGAAGTAYGVTPYFLSEFGIETTRNATILGAAALTLIVMLINIAGIRIATTFNNIAVVTEIVGGVGVAIVLFVYAIVVHPHPASFLFHQQPGAHGAYFGAFILAFLLGAYTFAGWELPADLAEETRNATTVAGRTILASVMAVAVTGLILLVGFSYASPNISTTLGEAHPVLSIIQYQWGSTMRELVDILFLISFVSVVLLIQAGAARLLFSLGRDNMAPFGTFFGKVHVRFKTPYTALIGTAVFGIAMFAIPALISEKVLEYILGTASVGFNLVYALVAAVYLVKARRGTLPQQFGNFSLGRWGKPVACASLIWQIFLVGTLTLPDINHNIGLTTLAMIAVGLAWFLVWVRPRVKRGLAGPHRESATPV
ncbi:MAG TPA: amino acid permease [Solirubrobacteraceae bacterium]|jgi:amino acid transporter|nr:amino acid permease [Solirubrobacteraceae bacterium]